MRVFYLLRKIDISGLSGTGTVAEGVIFSDGTVALKWLGEVSSFVIHDSIANVEKIHCHNGSSTIVYEK